MEIPDFKSHVILSFLLAPPTPAVAVCFFFGGEGTHRFSGTTLEDPLRSRNAMASSDGMAQLDTQDKPW